MDCGGFTGVVGILLERKSPNRDLLVRDRVEHGANDSIGEALLLVVVHDDDLFPVGSYFAQAKVLA